MTHFISLADFTAHQLRHLLAVSARLKQQLRQTGRNDPLLAGKTLAMVFEKPSLRTRVSFSVGMTQLGGSGLLLRQDEVGLDTREPAADVARVLAGMCDGIMARTFEHQKMLALARWSSVPVINGLTDYNHPCQAMADLLTLVEHFGGNPDGGDLKGRTIAFIGDGNNVARSLAVAASKFGMNFILAAPRGYELPEAEMALLCAGGDSEIGILADPVEAVKHADAIITDTWVSMGQESEKAERLRTFAAYKVDEQLLAAAPPHAVVLHCLPAYRGLEISEAVFEGPRSLVFQEAENRLHFQKGLLAVLLGGQ
jgi:ornithine carbamoyltransferase